VRDTEIFATLLGLTEGWSVSSVDLRPGEDRLLLGIEFKGKVSCPVCGKACPLYDHSEERSWRHLDTMQFMTIVSCRVPRANCAEHGVKQLSVPWSGPHSRFTALFERLAIGLLGMTRCQSRTAKLLRLSPTQVHEIMHRAVRRGLARRELGEISHIAIDEKSFQKGHVYGCVLSDTKQRRVIDLSCGRSQEAACQAMNSLALPHAVKTITMDMHDPFKNAAYACIPQAEIIHDRFHVAMNLSRAIDITRRAESKSRPELRYSRYVWLKNAENRSPNQRQAFNDLIELELKTGKVYAFKEAFRCFFEQPGPVEGTQFLSDWLTEARKTQIPALKTVANTLEANFGGLISYLKWRLTNGFAEGLNSMIQEINTVARGFRRFPNFRIAVLFFLGKLELNPC
jgi:transposase